MSPKKLILVVSALVVIDMHGRPQDQEKCALASPPRDLAHLCNRSRAHGRS
jgi:hypothetical protein